MSIIIILGKKFISSNLTYM